MTTLGKLGTAIAFGTLYVATVELYPTPVRGSALGLLLTTGKLGAIAAPQVHNSVGLVYAPTQSLVKR